eukprot:208466_1
MAQTANESNNHNGATSKRRSGRFSGKPKVNYYAERVWSLVEDEPKPASVQRRNALPSNASVQRGNDAQNSVQRRNHASHSVQVQRQSSDIMWDALREQIRVEERERLFCGVFTQYLLDLGHKFYGTLNDNGKDHPLRCDKTKEVNQQIMHEHGVPYFRSICEKVWCTSGGTIMYFQNFDWNALKAMFDMRQIRRGSEEDGYYFISNPTVMSYSSNSRLLRFKYTVRFGKIDEDGNIEEDAMLIDG